MELKLIFIGLLVGGGLVMFAWAESEKDLSKKVVACKGDLERKAIIFYITSATCFFVALFAIIFVMVSEASHG